MSHEPPEYLASLGRISIPALREEAQWDTAQGANVLLALVEAVEAAKAYLDKAPLKGHGEAAPLLLKLDDAIARFDFGEDE